MRRVKGAAPQAVDRVLALSDAEFEKWVRKLVKAGLRMNR